MFASSATRVSNHTEPSINARIRQQWKQRIATLSRGDRLALIDQRLDELDNEWDTERALQTNFAALSLVGVALASKVDQRWAALALGVPAFMIQHALQGWCPPLPLLRRMGFRTAREINEERFALQALRGDFDAVQDSGAAGMAATAVQYNGRPDLYQR